MNKTFIQREGERVKNTDDLYKKYIHMICRQESAVVYRMNTPMGEGIMHWYSIADGIDYVYSEIETYYPRYQEQKKLVNYIEIMYMAEGHAEFEMEDRRCASADKGDVLIFNSRIGVKKCNVGPEGMICISLIVFIDHAVQYLNDFFSTDEFTVENFYKEVRETQGCTCIQANERLENLFKDMMALPAEHGSYHRKLLALEAVITLNDLKNKRKYNDIYFSGECCDKVHKARKILSRDLDKDISIMTLSEMVELNRTTLQKVFKEIYGVTIHDYRKHVRMQEAKNLLLKEDMSITEIAGACGYANASKFSSAFKDTVGILPGKWRKKSIQNTL